MSVLHACSAGTPPLKDISANTPYTSRGPHGLLIHLRPCDQQTTAAKGHQPPRTDRPYLPLKHRPHDSADVVCRPMLATSSLRVGGLSERKQTRQRPREKNW